MSRAEPFIFTFQKGLPGEGKMITIKPITMLKCLVIKTNNIDIKNLERLCSHDGGENETDPLCDPMD